MSRFIKLYTKICSIYCIHLKFFLIEKQENPIQTNLKPIHWLIVGRPAGERAFGESDPPLRQ